MLYKKFSFSGDGDLSILGGQNGKPLGFMGYEMINAVRMVNRCLFSQIAEALSGREGGEMKKPLIDRNKKSCYK